MDGWQGDVQKNYIALAHPYHEGKWFSMFGWILSSGLGRDSVMDKWTDNVWTNEMKKVALAHFYREGEWCSKFGRIPSSGLGGDCVTDRWTDKWRHLHVHYFHFFFKKSMGIIIHIITLSSVEFAQRVVKVKLSLLKVKSVIYRSCMDKESGQLRTLVHWGCVQGHWTRSSWSWWLGKIYIHIHIWAATSENIPLDMYVTQSDQNLYWGWSRWLCKSQLDAHLDR